MSIIDIKSEFSALGCDIEDDDVSDQLELLSKLYKVDAGDLAAEWTAYAFNHELTSIDKENVVLFERDRYELRRKIKKESPYSRNTPAKNKRTFSKGDLMEDDDIMNLYSSDAYKTPTSIKNVNLINASTFSPAPAQGSPKVDFDSRSNSNQVVQSLGAVKDTKWTSTLSERVMVDALQSFPVDAKHIYMYQKYTDQVQSQNNRLLRTEKSWNKKNIELSTGLMESTQIDVTIAARVCCEGDTRLNEDNIMLRRYDNMVMPVNLSRLTMYSFFPGQIVTLQGTNPTGNTFIPTKVLDAAILPLSETADDGDLLLMVVSGPYTTNDNFTYDPLDEFLEQVVEMSPDAVILFGPFVDSKHSQIEDLPMTYRDLFDQIMVKIATTLKRVNTEIIIIPSQRDLHHYCVYPQCPMSPSDESHKIRDLTFLSDPSMFTLNGVKICLTSTDIIKHLGKHELSLRKTKTSVNRMENLITHILNQQSIYPLYPADVELPIDYALAEEFITIQDTSPNLLILPSDLSCFIKVVNGCIALNPGRLTRGKAAGMFTRLFLSCEHGKVISHAVEIIRI